MESYCDILGNENRRRILKLLSEKSCHVNEIVNILNVAPKSVISHLNKLEESGIIKGEIDNKRRKNYSIKNSIYLEVTIMPSFYEINSDKYHKLKEIKTTLKNENQYLSLKEILKNIKIVQSEIYELTVKKNKLQYKHNYLTSQLVEYLNKNITDELEYKILLKLCKEAMTKESLIYLLKEKPDKIDEKLNKLKVNGYISESLINNQIKWKIKEI